MKRIQYDEYGGPELMHLADVESGSPGRGQVLVRVRAAAANPMDWKIRNGDMKMMTRSAFPRGLGHDFAGNVLSVGKGVTRFREGDQVLGAMSMKTSGAFAETVVAEENLLVHKPESLSFEEAAALPTVGLTALQCVVDKGQVRAGANVFVNGCLGGVGRSAVQLAKLYGASVGGSCRTSAKADAEALGISPVVDFEFDPVGLKGQYDVVIDTAGTMSRRAAQTLLKPKGRIIDINPSAAKMARAVVTRNFKPLIVKYSSKDLATVTEAAATGKLSIPIARSVPLSNAIEALTELEGARTPKGGKLIIIP
ncbi:MAG: NAD(P)-dependent alcohol dehydrogenase [Acidimicrobiales bacterium]